MRAVDIAPSTVVLTPMRRVAVVVRVDAVAGEAVVRRLADGALVSFRTSKLEALPDGARITLPMEAATAEAEL